MWTSNSLQNVSLAKLDIRRKVTKLCSNLFVQVVSPQCSLQANLCFPYSVIHKVRIIWKLFSNQLKSICQIMCTWAVTCFHCQIVKETFFFFNRFTNFQLYYKFYFFQFLVHNKSIFSRYFFKKKSTDFWFSLFYENKIRHQKLYNWEIILKFAAHKYYLTNVLLT